MDEYGNIKPGQFKNDSLSLAMASVPVFPPRPMPGTANPFQNPAMSTPYGFNMDGTLTHASSIYNHPGPPHHPNVTKMNIRPSDAEARQMGHTFPKPPSMAYHNFAPLGSCNIVTTNGFFNINTPSDMSKHSFEDVLNSPPSYNTDTSINTQMMPPKTQYHQPSSSIMTEIGHYSQEPVSSFVQNLVPLTNDIQVHSVEQPKKRSKSQKAQPKSSAGNSMSIANVDQNHQGNNSINNNTVHNEIVVDTAASEIQSNLDLVSKLYSGKNIYWCGFCDLKLSSNEALLGHLNTHTNLLPYHCGICGVAFIEGGQLMKHIQHSHAAKAPYACGLCTNTFHQNDEFKEHMEKHEKSSNSDCIIKTKLPQFVSDRDIDRKRTSDKQETVPKAEETDTEGEADEEDGTENYDPAADFKMNASASTILIGKDTNFSLRKRPSKIVMDDVDLNSVCTVIVEPSSAGGVRKKHLFKCNYCEKVCKDKGSLVSHVRTHTKGRPYECNICFAKFKQYAHLSDHVMTKHTKERPFVCDRCAKTFNRKSHLQDHIRLRHTEDKLYHCPECSATFYKRTEFSDHKRSHGKPPKYQCNMCPRQFRNVTDYERHIRSHTKEKRYECDVCHLTFGLLANAKKHMIKHNSERPFKCDVCPKSYHFEHDFKRHKLTHLNKKPFPCPDCYKSFKNASLLKKHAKETHMKVEEDSNQKPFQCNTCKKRFRIQWDLDRHRKIHAKKKPFPCCYCYKTYGSEAMLTKHAKVHVGQDLPLYDHSKDIVDDSDEDEKPKKRGRKPKARVTKIKQNRNNTDDSEIDQKPKGRGRPPKRKLESPKSKNNKTKRRGRPPKQREDSDSEEKSSPQIKITFKTKKLRTRKFPCPECNKAFMSKAMLKRHSRRVHNEEDSEDETEEESFSYEKTKTIPAASNSFNENANDATSVTEKITYKVKNTKRRNTNATVHESLNNMSMMDTIRDEETTRDDDTTRDEDSTRDEDTTRYDTSTFENDKSSSSSTNRESEQPNAIADSENNSLPTGNFSQVTESKKSDSKACTFPLTEKESVESSETIHKLDQNYGNCTSGGDGNETLDIPQPQSRDLTTPNHIKSSVLEDVDASAFFQHAD